MYKHLKKLNVDNFIASLTKNIKKYINYIIHELILTKSKLKNLTETNFKLGIYHLNNHNLNDASLRFHLVIWLNPSYVEAYYYLAYVFLLKKQYEKSKKQLIKTLELAPNHEKAKSRFNQLNKQTPLSIPLNIIKEDLDYAANSYYDLNEDQIINEINTLFLPLTTEKNILEIGCKTGELGKKLKNLSNNFKIVGLEMSDLMIAQAKNKNYEQNPIYEYLSLQDYIIDQKIKGKYDIIIFNKSFNFVRDFEPILQNMLGLLNENGIIIFISQISENLNYNFENNCYLSNINELDKIFENLKIKQISQHIIFENSEAIFVLKNI